MEKNYDNKIPKGAGGFSLLTKGAKAVKLIWNWASKSKAGTSVVSTTKKALPATRAAISSMAEPARGIATTTAMMMPFVASASSGTGSVLPSLLMSAYTISPFLMRYPFLRSYKNWNGMQGPAIDLLRSGVYGWVPDRSPWITRWETPYLTLRSLNRAANIGIDNILSEWAGKLNSAIGGAAEDRAKLLEEINANIAKDDASKKYKDLKSFANDLKAYNSSNKISDNLRAFVNGAQDNLDYVVPQFNFMNYAGAYFRNALRLAPFIGVGSWLYNTFNGDNLLLVEEILEEENNNLPSVDDILNDPRNFSYNLSNNP